MAAHLALVHGTLVCRSIPVGNHCSTPMQVMYKISFQHFHMCWPEIYVWIISLHEKQHSICNWKEIIWYRERFVEVSFNWKKNENYQFFEHIVMSSNVDRLKNILREHQGKVNLILQSEKYYTSLHVWRHNFFDPTPRHVL